MTDRRQKRKETLSGVYLVKTNTYLKKFNRKDCCLQCKPKIEPALVMLQP